jgi:uncharacterized FlaG/YvyC family protein
MDVNLTTQVPLPQSQQSQQAPNATSQAGATSTLQDVPDNVVTAATQGSETNAREDDALRRQERAAREQAISQLEDLQLQGLQTRVGFDAESDRVFLEVLLPNTEEVIQRIPSENLIQFLQSQVDAIGGDPGAPAQTLDRSI